MQPGITDLFGANSTFTGTPKVLTIPLSSLPALTTANPTALELHAALVSFAHNWISANTDQSVLADSTLTIASPITKNGVAKTQFQYATRYYGVYNAPTFDPNAV
jgi:hypothetical protein